MYTTCFKIPGKKYDYFRRWKIYSIPCGNPIAESNLLLNAEGALPRVYYEPHYHY